MKSPLNRIFVTIEKKWNDEIKVGDLTLFQDTTFRPEWNVNTVGTVISTPGRVIKDYYEDDFVANVLPGDKLYFNFNVTLDLENLIEHEGEEYWGVDYYNAIAVVRDGKIIPVGSYILIEPQEEEITSSFIIIPESVKKVETNRGIVFSSNMAETPAGSLVEYDPVGKFENEIEGKKLYCMYNSNIYYKYNDTNRKAKRNS